MLCAGPPVDCSNAVQADQPFMEPYGDIPGTGVLVGFLGTGYLVLVLQIVYYMLCYEPDRNPFLEMRSDSASDSRNAQQMSWWRPNEIDSIVLTSLRSLPPLHWVSRRLIDSKEVLTQPILALCDGQILTGLSIMVSGWISLPCGLSAHHWQIIVQLVWFSSITHLSSFIMLRVHLRHSPVYRYTRMIMMLALLGMLIGGISATRSFNWPDALYRLYIRERHLEFSPEVEAHLRQCVSGGGGHDDEYAECLARRADEFTSLFMSAATVCFFDRDSAAKRYWDSTVPEPPSAAYQSMVVSIFLLGLAFITRLSKASRRASQFATEWIRRPLGSRSERLCCRLAGVRSSSSSSSA
ncbi:hypothetical protein Micbo1qcDRAFT_200449 [Microdochium bolleyi]|uniref:Uncharacterized protein n=1 Tax=Microdochium bolleyi TaxID=196109 RepID=A0A136JCV0_9PEZI|nr:hypothetical protein Micbo1qcDRAFT_200449 [Microdochium bolleyi]